jgi:hypothetical protein
MQWGAGALVLLLAQGPLASRSAWAGCSHLVTSKSDRLVASNLLDPLITGGFSTSAAGELADDPLNHQGPKRPAPCSGSGCTSGVPAPLPTSSIDTHITDHWGVLNAAGPLALESPRHETVEATLVRPAGQQLFVFHPPPA